MQLTAAHLRYLLAIYEVSPSRPTCKMTWEISHCSNLSNKEEKAVTSVMKKQIY